VRVDTPGWEDHTPVTDSTAVVPSPGRPATGRGRLFTKGRIITSLLLAIAGACLIVGFQEAADPKDKATIRPAAILNVFPREGTTVLRQERIGGQLADGFTGELVIDDVQIPLDQLERPQDPIGQDAQTAAAKGLAGLNEVSFTPGEGKEIERLRTGTVTAKLLFTERATGKSDSYSWTFSVT
jgi:hypothetical protein